MIRRLTPFLLLLLLPLAALAGERGYLGFGIAVDGEGFFVNPILAEVTIDSVTPGSPAAAAGLVTGDRIVEIEGHPVKGARARDLKSYLEREVGQAVRMVIRKESGDLKPVTLVAAPKVEP